MTKIKKVLTFGSTLSTALVVATGNVLAAGNTISINPTNSDYAGLNNIRVGSIISTGINALLGVAGVIAFIFLLWGGLQWILSGGDKEGTEKARKRITAALIGLAIVFSAYALIWILGTVFGITSFGSFQIPTIPGAS